MLDTLTDRQLLIRLIALLTSLVTVQHRGCSPSSTACRNGNTCSYRPSYWFSHARHAVRLPGTTQSTKSSAFSQRSAPTCHKPRSCSASATPLPPCFSGRNVFGPLALQWPLRRSPGRHRPLPILFDAPLPPPPSSSSPAQCQRRQRRRLCNDIDDFSSNEIQRIAVVKFGSTIEAWLPRAALT